MKSKRCSFVIESNFYPQWHTPIFLNLKQRYPFTSLEIRCVADGEALYRRFVARSEAGLRHPGHVDHLSYAEFRETLLRGRNGPLQIGGEYIAVDTTDFTLVDYEGLRGQVSVYRPHV